MRSVGTPSFAASGDTGSPDHGPRGDSLVPDLYAVSTDVGYESVGMHLDTDSFELLARFLREARRERRQQAVVALHQDDARVTRVNAAEVVDQCLTSDLAQGTRELGAGRPSADDHECHPRTAARWIRFALSCLVCQQDPPANLERILNCLQPRCMAVPGIVAKVRVRRTRREDQVIVSERTLPQEQLSPFEVDSNSLRENHARVLLPPQDTADRCRDVARIQSCGRYLIEKRLEEVMVASVDKSDAYRCLAKSLGRVQAAKPSPDDD